MARTPQLDLPFDGRRLRSRRVRARLTQEELAEAATAWLAAKEPSSSKDLTSVSRFQVVRAESCKNMPHPDALDAFVAVLNCEVDDLLTPSSEVTGKSA